MGVGRASAHRFFKFEAGLREGAALPPFGASSVGPEAPRPAQAKYGPPRPQQFEQNGMLELLRRVTTLITLSALLRDIWGAARAHYNENNEGKIC